jgi:NADH-quinone oxidoreductase subunit J
MAVAFYILGTFLVLSAWRVVTSRNLVHSAVFLALSFLCLAGIYVLLEAEFLAVIQVLVYAGGIMVLFLFAVMLVSFRGVQEVPSWHRQAGIGILTAAVVFLTLFLIVITSPFEPNPMAGAEALQGADGFVGAVAQGLFGPYVFAFELLAVFLLAAMVGAILLARKEM